MHVQIRTYSLYRNSLVQALNIYGFTFMISELELELELGLKEYAELGVVVKIHQFQKGERFEK